MTDQKRSLTDPTLPAAKVSKNSMTIGTHSGAFHCDEVLACWFLHQTNTYKDADIVRSRDPAVLEKCDIVVDVGGVYDHSKNLYDHHQREFQGTMSEKFDTRLSSAGLVYKHYGHEVIRNLLNGVEESTISLLWDRMYVKFVEAIDAIDNGISQYDSELAPKYLISSGLSSRVALFNPRWNQSVSDDQVMENFKKAMALCGHELTQRLDFYAESWLPAREVVARALASRSEVHESGKVILLSQRCPWGEHLNDLESEQNLSGDSAIVYVIFGSDGDWRVQAVPVRPGSFESRKALPEVWRGKRDEELSTLAGIPNLVFIHATGFIGGAKTKEGAFALADAALKI